MKKTYFRPVLVAHGSIVTLTMGKEGDKGDVWGRLRIDWAN